jgi:hypothetical protein
VWGWWFGFVLGGVGVLGVGENTTRATIRTNVTIAPKPAILRLIPNEATMATVETTPATPNAYFNAGTARMASTMIL